MSVAGALAPLDEALRLDGYELTATELAPSHVRVEVAATGAACPDCLIPRPLFGDMVRARLGEVLHGTWEVEVVYPGDGA